MVFHGNNGAANAPVCHIMPTLPALFQLLIVIFKFRQRLKVSISLCKPFHYVSVYSCHVQPLPWFLFWVTLCFHLLRLPALLHT